jgi:hypothetical protein
MGIFSTVSPYIIFQAPAALLFREHWKLYYGVFDIHFSTNFPKQSFQSIRQTQDCPECIEGQSKIASGEATSETQKNLRIF